MANTDQLLDLGEADDPNHIVHEPIQSEEIRSPLDPDTQFLQQEPREGEPDLVDEFDPFAAPRKNPETADLSAADYLVQEQDSNLLNEPNLLGDFSQENNSLVDTTVEGNMSAVETSQPPSEGVKLSEAEIQDLMGGFPGENNVTMETTSVSNTLIEDIQMTSDTSEQEVHVRPVDDDNRPQFTPTSPVREEKRYDFDADRSLNDYNEAMAPKACMDEEDFHVESEVRNMEVENHDIEDDEGLKEIDPEMMRPPSHSSHEGAEPCDVEASDDENSMIEKDGDSQEIIGEIRAARSFQEINEEEMIAEPAKHDSCGSDSAGEDFEFVPPAETDATTEDDEKVIKVAEQVVSKVMEAADRYFEEQVQETPNHDDTDHAVQEDEDFNADTYTVQYSTSKHSDEPDLIEDVDENNECLNDQLPADHDGQRWNEGEVSDHQITEDYMQNQPADSQEGHQDQPDVDDFTDKDMHNKPADSQEGHRDQADVDDITEERQSVSHTSLTGPADGLSENMSDGEPSGSVEQQYRSRSPSVSSDDHEHNEKDVGQVEEKSSLSSMDKWHMEQEQDFQPPKRYVKQEEEKRADRQAPGVVILDKFKHQGGSGEMICKSCGKRVYEMEKMIADKAIYHKTCFKCSHCKRVLSLGNFAALEGQLYCKPHFVEMFKTKGNYEEGFGKQRHREKWNNKLNVASSNGIQSNGHDHCESHLKEVSQERNEEFSNQGENKTDDETEDDSCLPSISNLKSRFEGDGAAHENEQVESEDEEYRDRKPVRKMTPPRDELESGISAHERIEKQREERLQMERRGDIVKSGVPDDYEKELPPQGMSKNIRDVFKNLEDKGQPPPSPQNQYNNSRSSKSSRRSPDSGISVNGHQSSASRSNTEEREVDPSNVRREDEPVDYEKELPERGYTKNLVAQWRTMETTATASPAALTPGGQSRRSPASRSYSERRDPTQTPVNVRPRSQTPELVAEEGEDGYRSSRPMNGDVVRESDKSQEQDELPPPSFTKNMLAKFQTIQAQESEQARSAPVRKQFKWQVHEAPPLRGQHHEQNPAQGVRDRPFNAPANHDRSHNEEDQTLEEELPPPAFTRNMLERFRSMEDSNAPPPTPEETARIKKKIGSTVSPGPTRRFDQSRIVNIYNDERQQPDGDEQMHGQHNERHRSYSDDYNHEDEGGEFENEPVYNPDLVRETDNVDEEELPEQGTTRNLLAKFQAMQAS